MQQVENNGLIGGVFLCKDGPKISHLFFANDSLLFCQANDHDSQAMLEILEKYEHVSGQQINRDKTQIFFFSSNTSRPMQEHITDLLGVSVVAHYEKYLGLPSFVGRA